MTPELLERYLNILGVHVGNPSTDALYELIQAHMVKIPFENVSKLYYNKQYNHQGIPNLELYLDGIERFNFGGTCYSNNYYLYQLLANLGYQIKLCGAKMLKPDVHLVSIVTVEQREYLIDVGYAAPFLTPLPRDLTTDYAIVQGLDKYMLRPQDTQGFSRMDHYRDGNLQHSYLVNPLPRKIQEFDHIIVDSYREDSTFMNKLLLARFFPSSSLVLRNLSLIESQGSESKSKILNNRDELVQAAYDFFKIPMEVTMDVVKDIGLFNDA